MEPTTPILPSGKKIFVIFLVLLSFFACKDDEKPNSKNSTLKVTGIELVSGTIPNARQNASVSWQHIFPTELQLTFKGNGKSYTLKVNPNDFSKSYSLELPSGTYSYEGSTASANTTSPELPITVKGEVQVGNSSTDLMVKGYSTYGLITFSKRNLSSGPTISAATPFPFFEKSGFYYLYHKSEISPKVDLQFTTGKKYRIPVSNTAFSHSQFQFRTTGDTGPDLFVNKDFALNQRTFTLSTEGFPTEIVPYSPLELPQSQKETSGLAWIQGKLFSINDGGNPAEIYELNPSTGVVTRTIKLNGIPNVDWEDLAVSPTHLFVGDFGNNAGNRKNLRILKISISELMSQNQVSAELIEFSFEDQTQFSFTENSHNFDCEAMVFLNGQLHLFSKNWQDLRSKHYTLPASAGKQVARLLGSRDVQGLVCGADVSPDGKHLILIGYENKGVSSRSFVWAFPDFSGNGFASAKGYQFFLGSPLSVGQTEGITFTTGLITKFSGESISVIGTSTPPRLAELDWNGIFTP
jgi:hypothetical protein